MLYSSWDRMSDHEQSEEDRHRWEKEGWACKYDWETTLERGCPGCPKFTDRDQDGKAKHPLWFECYDKV
jgi:hypothetical protein